MKALEPRVRRRRAGSWCKPAVMPRSVGAAIRRAGLGWSLVVACIPGVDSPALLAGPASVRAPASAPLLPYETLDQVRYRLLEEQDSDCDQKITARDQSSRRFRFRLQGQAYDVQGSYALSTLLEELELARRSDTAPRLDRVGEDPIARTSRRIRTEYWPALTRRLDEDGLPTLLDDPNVPGAAQRVLYVPGDDARALAYFRRAGRRYDAAYAELARTTAGIGASDLAGSELTAMLATADGRESLAELSRRLATAARAIDYPGLSRFLLARVKRLGQLFQQASRPCVNTNATRIGRVADQARDLLATFLPRTLAVRELPERREWPEWIATLGAAHGITSLALEEVGDTLVGVPFVVPGGRLGEMHGWQSHFILRGLIADEQFELAKGLVDNAIYVIEHYGATLEANRTYYLTRSQPPFIASMIRALWEALPAPDRDRRWLRRALGAAIREYDEVWGQAPRASSVCRGEGDQRACLDHYAGVGRGKLPEVEPGHFDGLWRNVGRSLEGSYWAGELPERDLVKELDSAFQNDRCMRESGHDTTYRWFYPTPHGRAGAYAENRCSDMLTVDLNSLLYKYEVDVAFLLDELGMPLEPTMARRAEAPRSSLDLGPGAWCARARNRFELMKTYLWSARDGLFYDALLTETGAIQTGYVSATTLYPLWATSDTCGSTGKSPPFSVAAKSLLVTNALRKLEAPGGLLASAQSSRDRFSPRGDREWDHPNGWAPHQMLAWYGLEAHGFRQDADRLIAAWLYMLVNNVIDQNGDIPEKFDVIARIPAAISETANGDTSTDSIATEGLAWMNASFQVGLARLSAEERRRLNQSLTPTDDITADHSRR
jgi:alpha,alpha-trehalase